jgi:hypothetical protein
VVAAVVGEPQERKILDRVADVVGTVDRPSEAGSLGARMTGPGLPLREAQLDASAARGDKVLLAGLTAMEMQQVILPSDQDWPRTSYGITVQPANRTTPTLVAFEQTAARDNYKVWGWVRLLRGITMPQFAGPDLGSASLPPDDTSLKVAPRAAVEQYASVLNVDGRSRYADGFSDDELRQHLRERGELQVRAVDEEKCEGAFEVAYERTKDPVKAVRTVDGGALVMAAMISTEQVVANKEGCEIGPPPATTAEALWKANGWPLNEDGTTNTVTLEYRDLVALYVPPAGSEARIRLLGYERVNYAVDR